MTRFAQVLPLEITRTFAALSPAGLTQCNGVIAVYKRPARLPNRGRSEPSAIDLEK
jgi:hypothetical protein